MSMSQMGFTIAVSGLGGFLGMTIMGAISDHIGRKNAMILAGFLAAVAGFIIAMLPVGTSVILFCIPFFFWGFFGIGTFPMYLGTLPTEAVPPDFAGTAVGIPTGVGEIIGAAVMPTLAGILADKFGLFAPIWMATIACLVICIVSVFYVETAPKKLSKMRTKPTRDDHLLRPFRGKQPTAAA